MNATPQLQLKSVAKLQYCLTKFHLFQLHSCLVASPKIKRAVEKNFKHQKSNFFSFNAELK
jgi:hypothetical protein